MQRKETLWSINECIKLTEMTHFHHVFFMVSLFSCTWLENKHKYTIICLVFCLFSVNLAKIWVVFGLELAFSHTWSPSAGTAAPRSRHQPVGKCTCSLLVVLCCQIFQTFRFLPADFLTTARFLNLWLCLAVSFWFWWNWIMGLSVSFLMDSNCQL